MRVERSGEDAADGENHRGEKKDAHQFDRGRLYFGWEMRGDSPRLGYERVCEECDDDRQTAGQ